MKTLDQLKNVAKSGTEWWWARDIMPHLGYERWENFSNAIERAKQACQGSGENPDNHFREVTKKITAGKGAQVDRTDCALTRLGSYLVAMNCDPAKPEVAQAQSYFAFQTRRQELSDQALDLERRMSLRERVKKSVKQLGAAAKEAGVRNYGRFHDAGYKGLYGGRSLSEIKAMKGIVAEEDFLDCIGRAELAANEFKNTQAELKIKREQATGEDQACAIHHEVGQDVRDIMVTHGGQAPEKLPAEESLKAIAKRNRKKLQGPST